MKSISTLKKEARESLKGNWAPAVLATIVFFFIDVLCLSPNYVYPLFHPDYAQDMAYAMQTNNVADMMGMYGKVTRLSSIGSLLAILVGNVMTIGYACAILKFKRDKDTEITSNMFSIAFKDYWHKVLGMLLMGIFIFLWTLLLVIPGIIKTFSYAMTPYILHEYPNVGVNDAIDISRKMMKGHKLDLFLLELSFIGWMILTAFSLGIGLLWLAPYMQTAHAGFYEEVKAEYIEKYGEMTLA